MNNIETIHLIDILNNIEDESSLDEFISNTLNNTIDLTLCEYLEDLFSKKNLSKSTVIKNSDIDRTYGYQILKGDKKPSRDKILQICIGAGFNLNETNKALKLGNCGELYPKSLRDSIIIFGINKNADLVQINELLYNYNLDLF